MNNNEMLRKINKSETDIAELNKQLDTITQEVEKPITLNKCDSEMLSAIQGGEGTSFELLSIPRENSVTPYKLENEFLNVLVDFNKISLEYEEGAINSVGTLNNSVSNRYRTKSFLNVYDGFKIINNSLKDIVLYLYNSEVASSDTLTERIILAKGNIKAISDNSYLLIDLMTNSLEEGNDIYLEYLSQKDIKKSTVSIDKLAEDTIELLNTKAKKR